jgi:serine/threonine protein kinase
MLAAGDRFGGYEIHSRLGAGGMGEVYRARDLGCRPASLSMTGHRRRRCTIKSDTVLQSEPLI